MNKKIWARVFALLVMLCMLSAVPVFVSAEGETETGSVTFKVDASAEGCGVELLPIGSIVDEKIVLDDAFSWIDVDKLLEGDADYLFDTSWQAQDQALETASDLGIKKMLNADGTAVWKDVPVDKVYLIYEFHTKKAVFQPSIFTIPMYVDNERLTEVVVSSKQVVLSDESYLGAVILNKIGYENRRLDGAEFTLWEKRYYYEDEELPVDAETAEDDYGKYYWHQLGSLTTDEHGQIKVDELPMGDYRFIETQAPEGYITDSRPREFSVTEMGTVKLENDVYVADYGKVEVLNIENKIDPDDPPPYYIEGEGSGEDSRTEESVASDIIIPGDGNAQLTSDDIKNYLIIGGIVGLSLITVIVLILIGGRKKKDSGEE